MLTTSTVIRHMLSDSNNILIDKLLYLGLTPDLYQTRFGSNLNLFLNLPVDLLVALLLPIGM